MKLETGGGKKKLLTLAGWRAHLFPRPEYILLGFHRQTNTAPHLHLPHYYYCLHGP